MSECDWAILCDYAFLDVGRKMCLIGIFDKIYANNVPSALHQCSLAIKLLGHPKEEIQFRIEIIRPTGGQLAQFEGTATAGDSGVAELQVGMAGLPLPDFGTYGFSIHSGDQLLKTATATVMKPPEQTTPNQ